MSTEAQDYLIDKFQDTILYAHKEFDLTYADVMGSLEFVKAQVFQEAAEAQEDAAEGGGTRAR